MRRPLQVCVCLVALGALVVQPHLYAQEPERPSFSDWLTNVRAEALARGIRQDVVDQALGDLAEPLPIIIERDRSQAEVVLPLEAYVNRRLTRKMITSAREMFARHQPLLTQIGAKYGVSPRMIVSIWGIESNFGRFSGVRPTVAALATLAWDPRRATFFRSELFNALEILNRGDIELSKMTGSWAGAMGQPQFMPSSYLEYAEDYDGDGRRDIWASPADVFASIANYLKGHGWSGDERWGREVSISAEARKKIAAEVQKRDGTCQATRNMTAFLPLSDWAALGVRTANGTPLPKADINAALVSGASRHFLVYGNYDVLLTYNCAHAYAVSVALLADRLGTDAPAPATKPATRSPRRPAASKPAADSAAVPIASAAGPAGWAQ